MITTSAFFLVILCAAIAAFSELPTHKQIRACNEGDEERRGSFVFRCQNGHLVPAACVMRDGSHIQIGLTSAQNNFVTACWQGSWNSIQTKVVACLDDNGHVFQSNSVFQWRGGQYRCILNANGGAEIRPVNG